MESACCRWRNSRRSSRASRIRWRAPSETAVNPKGQATLFATLSRIGESFANGSRRFPFVEYMTEVLTSPSANHSALVEHLAFAFFSLSALRMDPEGHRFEREYLERRTLMVDSNILVRVV